MKPKKQRAAGVARHVGLMYVVRGTTLAAVQPPT